MKALLGDLECRRERVERGVERGVKGVVWTGLAWVCVQLGGIVFLTGELGWDLMGMYFTKTKPKKPTPILNNSLFCAFLFFFGEQNQSATC